MTVTRTAGCEPVALFVSGGDVLPFDWRLAQTMGEAWRFVCKFADRQKRLTGCLRRRALIDQRIEQFKHPLAALFVAGGLPCGIVCAVRHRQQFVVASVLNIGVQDGQRIGAVLDHTHVADAPGSVMAPDDDGTGEGDGARHADNSAFIARFQSSNSAIPDGVSL